jgi:hypothetical protein
VNLFDNPPDLDKYPNLNKLEGFEAIVEAGEVLYIPAYWFHQMEVISSSSKKQQQIAANDVNITVNFWYKAAKVNDFKYPLRYFFNITF